MKIQYVSILLAVFLIGCESTFIRPEKLEEYTYNSYDLRITETSGDFFHLSISDRNSDKILNSKIYIKFDDKIHFLNDLDESIVSKAYKSFQPITSNSRYGGRRALEYGDSNTAIIFLEGKLVYFDINQLSSKGEVGPEFSTSPEGPFYRIPIRKKQVIELFGEPDEIKELSRL